MEISRAIETRISVRSFNDDPVQIATRKAILNAGRQSQSGHNSQHWRLIVVDEPNRLAELAAASGSGDWIVDADFAVVIVTDPDRYYHEIDAGRLITHMQFAAWDRGIGSCIFTNFDGEQYHDLLDVPPELAITAVVGFGYPTFDVQAIQGQKDRMPLDEITFDDRYGKELRWPDRK